METRLIDVLQPIKDNDYQLPENQSLQELTTMMLQKIGSVHPVLRDDLIHTIFTTFIERGHYSHEQLKNILQSILNKNYLFYRIGTSKREEDAVFKRSFSVLLIPPIMNKHRRTPFLKEAEVHRVWHNLKKYMQQESDHRGYVKGKGWAHAMAHAADALYHVASCDEITEAEIREMLPIIKAQFLIDHPYLFDEEERMVTAVMIMFKKIKPQARIEWLETLLYVRESWQDPREDIIINNSKHFLRALYFRMLEGDHRDLRQVLENLLRELRKQEAY
ncbi:hypothetical protein CEH05_06455 [Halobacillus halophilus]|uniref:DUF2785 domain-containing protein n=1 Tax=Halobacillus halophilus (strain ATCC 35676 / DSM 2266 / JCM 20832 / KCTC 3685 / LMG 17431 / NBRC 102448 / NCIMB 2269) TaxID=866895 RepID=I0JKF7_HALH3|nr:DUF2785 domain-containing protein [Halobacillus halophilus]ASF38772.1 hypothetical protein CEH05_06455 [Halobacillus halophilus]CCG44626.1 hypothetical protein HBHAL_2276 [Halobacillus halophilus DSM 2266]